MSLSRMFTTEADAMATLARLTDAGFREDSVHVFGFGTTAAKLEAHGVLKPRAALYAEQLAGGSTMLLVEAPLGSAALATDILEDGVLSNSGEPRAQHEGEIYDEQMPVSSALRMPLLLDNPTPLSSWLNWPLLSQVGPRESWFGLPLLLKDALPTSWLLGMPLVMKGSPTLWPSFNSK